MKKQISIDIIANDLIKYASKNILDGSVTLQKTDKLMDFDIDSHNLLELIIYLEREFAIKIPDHDLTIGNLSTIESLAYCAYDNFKLADAG